MKSGHSPVHHRLTASHDVVVCVRTPAAPDHALWATGRSGSSGRHLPDGGDLVDLPVDLQFDLPVDVSVDVSVDGSVDLPVDPVPDDPNVTRAGGIDPATPAEVGRANEPLSSDRRAPAGTRSRAVALPSI